MSDNRITPKMTRPELDDLIIANHDGGHLAVLDAVIESADDRFWLDPDEMDEGDVIIFSVCNFVMQVENGGIWQFLTNPQGRIADKCAASLRRIGLEKYACIVDEAIALFTTSTDSRSDQWKKDLDKFLEPEEGGCRYKNTEAFDEVEEAFWKYNRENEDEVFEAMYDYIYNNRDLFSRHAQ